MMGMPNASVLPVPVFATRDDVPSLHRRRHHRVLQGARTAARKTRIPCSLCIPSEPVAHPLCTRCAFVGPSLCIDCALVVLSGPGLSPTVRYFT